MSKMNIVVFFNKINKYIFLSFLLSFCTILNGQTLSKVDTIRAVVEGVTGSDTNSSSTSNNSNETVNVDSKEFLKAWTSIANGNKLTQLTSKAMYYNSALKSINTKDELKLFADSLYKIMQIWQKQDLYYSNLKSYYQISKVLLYTTIIDNQMSLDVSQGGKLAVKFGSVDYHIANVIENGSDIALTEYALANAAKGTVIGKLESIPCKMADGKIVPQSFELVDVGNTVVLHLSPENGT